MNSLKKWVFVLICLVSFTNNAHAFEPVLSLIEANEEKQVIENSDNEQNNNTDSVDDENLIEKLDLCPPGCWD